MNDDREKEKNYLLIWFLVRQHAWLSGRKQQTHNLSPMGRHRFKPCCMQKLFFIFLEMVEKIKI